MGSAVKALTILWHRCKSRHPENHMALFINNASRQSRQFNIYLVTIILLPMAKFKILHPLKGTMKWPGLVQTTLPAAFFTLQAEHYYFQISLRFTYTVTRTRPD